MPNKFPRQTPVPHEDSLLGCYDIRAEDIASDLGCREATVKFCRALSNIISNVVSAQNVETGLPYEPSFGS